MAYTVLEAARSSAKAHAGEVAYITDSRNWTFGEIDDLSDRIAQGLLAIGVGYGDRVACRARWRVRAGGEQQRTERDRCGGTAPRCPSLARLVVRRVDLEEAQRPAAQGGGVGWA